jgi:hypothetical protein
MQNPPGAATRQKDRYLRAQFFRLKSRRGPQKAILAVAASMLTAAYHMPTHDVDYRDLGADHFDRRAKAKLAIPPDPAPSGPRLRRRSPGGVTHIFF